MTEQLCIRLNKFWRQHTKLNKNKIQQHAKKQGYTNTSEYIMSLIEEDIKN